MYVRRLVEALEKAVAAQGVDELVLFQSIRARERAALPAGDRTGVRRVFTPSHHRLEQWTLPIELAWSGLDVLHSPDFIPPFWRRCRSVITVHDLAFLRYPEYLTADSRRYFNNQIRRATASADRIIAVSQATRRDLIDLAGASGDKIDVIYEAGDPLLHPSSDHAGLEMARRTLGLPEDFVLFLGTLEPRKNIPTLVRAFSLLKSRGYAGQLVLAGARGWLYDNIYQEVDRLGMGSEVVFLERFEREDLQTLYGAARLFVFPSAYEGFGLPVVEAMSCGAPVVTSNVSSLPEIAGDAALMVNPADADELAAAMQRVLEDPACAADLRRKGLERARKFSWERAAAETISSYRRAVRS